VVEEALRAHSLSLERPADAQKLAQLLEVDAVAVGAVTDYSPYYPPRVGLVVEWYAAESAYRPIPPGYGLPWGTPEEAEIPQRVVFAADLAAARADYEVARAQRATWTAEPGAAGAPPRSLPVGNVMPVVRHVATFNGHDAEVTAALAEYVARSDDGRVGGWQSYLQRSDDFIRFCCHRHVQEMLVARGGGETHVVWRYPDCR